ncbi:MAG: hypothetical protein E7310_00535 [Clostridiales bacterium]|nr:hypothetical protein [Clostridiales bacterium]
MSKEKIKKGNHTSHLALHISNKGITLVALIITIVVMLILIAVTLSLALGSNGVLNNLKEAKEGTEIAAEKEKLQDAVFATVKNSEGVNLDNIVLPEGFKEISRYENKTIYQGPSGKLYEVENVTGKITEIDKIPEEIEDLKITTDTQGVIFTKADGVTPGDPNNLKNGDIVIYGDYKYTYSGGWTVAVLDKTKEEYGNIAEEIYGKPIVNLFGTFKNCTNLVKAPSIPSTVTYLNQTFLGCSNLKNPPDLPGVATNVNDLFYGCSSLVAPPEMPKGITNMNNAFRGCSSLKTAPQIPETVKIMTYTFYNCSSLKEAPEIPNGVTNMTYTFRGCYVLEKTPVIPASVTNMNSTFYNCYKIQGEIIINASPTTYTTCFQNAGRDGTGIILKGSSTVLNELAATNTQGKVTVSN